MRTVPVLFLFGLLALPVSAAPELCEGAARQAALETGVPAELLLAITLVETGRDRGGGLRPWPWAANREGAGFWFDSRAELERFVTRSVAAGRNSVDIGCFQINWRWHGHHFAHPAELAEPLTGARHAARFLRRLHDELGSWEAAGGAYHSRTPHLAQAYAARIAAARPGASAGAASASHLPAALPPRNPGSAWPMPAPGAPGALSSLVPGANRPRPFLVGISP